MKFNRQAIDKAIDFAALVIPVLWVIAQIVVVATVWNYPQASDGGVYYRFAEECYSNRQWYPNAAHIENFSFESGYPTYIVYPGYINLLQAYIYIFGTAKAGFCMNILFNILTAWCVCTIARHLWNDRRIAKLALCIYCLYPLNVMIAGITMTEQPGIALTYLSLVWACRRRYGWIVASAVLMILSAYIRSTSLIFAFALILYMAVRDFGWRKTAIYVMTCFAGYLIVISLNYSITGYRFFSASTLGTNMLMGANDDCNGTYNTTDSSDSVILPQLPGKNVFQIDSINKAYATEWIIANPGKWTSMAAPKIFYLLYPGTWTDMGRDAYDPEIPGNKSLAPLVFGVKAWAHIYGWSLLALALAGIWIRRRKLWGVDGIILLPWLAGLALTVLTVGSPRYNMPYVPIMIYFSIWTLLSLFKRLKTEK